MDGRHGQDGHDHEDERVRIQRARERVWAELSRVARPDARFHRDFSSFIPDFEGSDAVAERLVELPAYASAGLIFITPDNCLELFRRRVIADGRRFLMTNHGLTRGFFLLEGSNVAPEDVKHAATLDGFESYATRVDLRELEARREPVGLLVTGSSAISRNGIRFGKGHGYFDLEWAVFSQLGLVSPDSVVAAVGHDCQLVEDVLTPQGHDVPVDVVVTPTRTVAVEERPPRPGAVRWDILPEERIQRMPALGELRALLAARA